MSDGAPPPIKQQKSYFDLKPEEVPLFKLRQLISHWVLPFNNLYVLCQTLGINAAVAGVVDLLTPKMRLFPWMMVISLILTLICVLLQSGWRPNWTRRARSRALGRMFLSEVTGSFCFLMLLLSTTGAAWAQAHPHGRGALASQSVTLQSLQDALLDLREGVAAVKAGVDSANAKLDQIASAQRAAQVEAAKRQASAAARPDALGVLSLSLLSRAVPDKYQLHLAAFITAPGISLNKARLQMRTRDASGSWETLDLTDRLAGAIEQQTLQLSVAVGIQELQLCLGADYPDAVHPHTLISSYRLDSSRADQALQPNGSPALVATSSRPCGP